MMGPGWQGGQPPFMQRFAAVDADQDGTVSAEEAAEQADAVFAAMDANGDDQLTLEEFLAVDMGMGPGVNRPAMAARREARREARYKSFDADADGTVTHEEFLSQHQKRFAGADRNGDGRTDPYEFRMMRWGS
jgi:Ca2+-binding EF-hand superfamily protein